MVIGEGLLPTFVTPDDVKAVQLAVSTDMGTVRDALARCATAGTFTPDKNAADWGAWQALKTRAQAFIDETPSWFHTKAQMERGEGLQRELASWHDKAKGLGCDAGPAPTVPAKQPDFGSMFMGLAPIALVVLGLYLLKK